MATGYTPKLTGWVPHTNDVNYVPIWLATEARKETLLTEPMINVKGFYDSTAGAWTACTGNNDNDDQAKLAAALVEGVSKTVWIGPGTWKISSTLAVIGAQVICSPYAIFVPSATDVDIVNIRANATWRGGIFNSGGMNYTGTHFTVDGQYNLGFGPLTGRVPQIRDIICTTQRVTGVGGGTCLHITSNGTSSNIVTWGRFENIQAYGFGTAIKMSLDGQGWITANQFNNLMLHSCVRCIDIKTESTATYSISGNNFNNLQFQPTDGAPTSIDLIRIDGGNNNCFTNYMAWDLGNLPDDGSGYAINIVSGNQNIFFGAPIDPPTYIYDAGENNVISGVTNKSWSGADLGTVQQRKWNPNGPATTSTNPDPLPDGGIYTSDEYTWPGLVLGDFMLICGARTYGVSVQANVTEAGKYKIQVANKTGAEVDFGWLGNWYVLRVPTRLKSGHDTWEPGTISAGAIATHNFTITGCTINDFALAGPGVDITGLQMSVTCTAANTITVVLYNFTTDPITLASSVWSVKYITVNRATNFSSEDFGNVANAATSLVNCTNYGMASDLNQFVLWQTAGVDCVDLLCTAHLKNLNEVSLVVQNRTGSQVTALNGAKTYFYKVIDPNDGLAPFM